MKKYMVSVVIALGLTGCNSEGIFSGGSGSGSGSVSSVSVSQTEASEHGIFVNDTATAHVTASGNGLVAYTWTVDGEVVGENVATYTPKNADWRKKLMVCASSDDTREVCSEELLVLPRHPVSATGPINYVY